MELPQIDSAAPFRWSDGDRIVHYGRGALADASELLAPGYVLLTTQRAGAAAPELGERAATVHHVPTGLVDEVASGL